MLRSAFATLLAAWAALALIGAARTLTAAPATDTLRGPPPAMPPIRRPAEPGPPDQPGRPAPPPGAAMGMPAPAGAPVDSFTAERDSLMKDVLGKIAGRENAPAESVFKDIRILKGMPAGRLVRVMNLGFGRSLGVSCRHCHVAGEWEKEDKPQKQIARDMWGMVNSINTELLPKIIEAAQSLVTMAAIQPAT